VLFVFTYAQEISIAKNWNLLGATEDLNTSFLRSDCASSVWTYENGFWKNFAHGKETFTSFSTISKGKGFWLYSKDGNCGLNSDLSKNPLARVYSPSHWVIPSKYVCKKNNGYFRENLDPEYYNGQTVCEANVDNAKKICEDSAARLPTIDELKEIIIGCGAIVLDTIEDFQANRTNETYKSCYRNLNFNDDFFMSFTITSDEYSQFNWSVRFGLAEVSKGYIKGTAQVRCFGSQELTNKLVIPPEDDNITSILIGRIGSLSSSKNKIISSKKSFQTFLDDVNATNYASVDKSWINILEKADIDFTKYNLFIYRSRQPSICSYNDTVLLKMEYILLSTGCLVVPVLVHSLIIS